jgi:hypothetical protein
MHSATWTPITAKRITIDLGRQSAIDWHPDSGDVTRLVRRQKDGGRGHIAWLADSA